MSTRLVVVGGGLAGIAAALRLAEAGHRPLVIESKRKLGGRAASFTDPRNDAVLDNCQHVVLGCCTHLLDLYERLGVLDQIEWHHELHWTTGNGQIDRVGAGILPAPLHLSGAFSQLSFLDKTDKRAIRRAMWRLIRMGASGRLAWAGRSFAAFLEAERQTHASIARFWNVIITSACNIGVDRCEAAAAIQVFQEGFLANRFGYSMGLPRVPLSRLYDPAIERIEAAGGDVVDGVAARSLAFDGRRITAVVTSDGALRCSTVVVAIPFDRLAKLASDTLRRADVRLQHLDRFEVSPILGVHLWFSHPIMTTPHLVLVDMGVQWLFNKGVDERGRQHVHAVVSAADAWMEMDEPAIVAAVVRDLERAVPASRGLSPLEARAVKERRATFALTPGVDAWRPRAAPGPIGSAGGGVPNLFLAGDWCDTGWPATMEGAVRSGYAAAGAIAKSDMSVGDLPPGLLSRVLGLRPGVREAM